MYIAGGRVLSSRQAALLGVLDFKHFSKSVLLFYSVLLGFNPHEG